MAREGQDSQTDLRKGTGTEAWPAAALSTGQLKLIGRAQRGDRESLRELWQSNRRWVAGIVLAFKSREAELDDLLQEVAVAMVKRIHSLRDPQAFRSWLRAVAINAARMDARTRGRRPEGRTRPLIEEPAASGDSMDLAQARREDGRRLLKMVLDLPEAYREPLLLRSVKGMSYREISAITDLPETTIETRIARGRRMLRERARQLNQTQPDTAAIPAEAQNERTTR